MTINQNGEMDTSAVRRREGKPVAEAQRERGGF